MSSVEPLPIVFTALSKRRFYCRDAVCEYVFAKGMAPLNPYCAFDYFLGDRAPRELVRQATNNLVRLADEVWVFGEVSDSVLFEILYAQRLEKPVRYLTIDDRPKEIRRSSVDALEFEPEVLQHFGSREVIIGKIVGVRTRRTTTVRRR
jgi:hypothetical protein